jgi:hypothetical protein
VSLVRSLLRISSRVGVPGTLVSLGDAGGRVLYLEACMEPVSIVAGLDYDDARRLHEALSVWLRDQDDREAPVPFARPAPLVAGAIRRGQLEATTVQLRTVPGS